MINANFDLDDWAIHLTYSNENLPPTVEEGEKEVRNYIRRINYRRKKAGLPNAKWIYVTEYDPKKKIRMHHHLLIEKGIDRKVMKNLWKNGTRTEVEELDRMNLDWQELPIISLKILKERSAGNLQKTWNNRWKEKVTQCSLRRKSAKW